MEINCEKQTFDFPATRPTSKFLISTNNFHIFNKTQKKKASPCNKQQQQVFFTHTQHLKLFCAGEVRKT